MERTGNNNGIPIRHHQDYPKESLCKFTLLTRLRTFNT